MCVSDKFQTEIVQKWRALVDTAETHSPRSNRRIVITLAHLTHTGFSISKPTIMPSLTHPARFSPNFDDLSDSGEYSKPSVFSYRLADRICRARG